MKVLKTEEKRENISKDIDQKASKKVFINLIIAVAFMAYFCVFSVVYKQWLHDSIEDFIKIATMVFLIISLILIEIAYKKSSETVVIHAFEALALAIHSLTTMYITKINNFDLNNYILMSSYGFSIYFVLKTIIITTKARKEFLNGLSDISEIVKKEEPKKKEASKKDKKNKKKDNEEQNNIIVDSVEESIVENETNINDEEIDETDDIEIDDDVDIEIEEALDTIANEEEENEKIEEKTNTNDKLAQLREKLKRLQEEDRKLNSNIKKNQEKEENEENEKTEKESNNRDNKVKKETKKDKIEEENNTPKTKKRGRPKKEKASSSTDKNIANETRNRWQ